MALFTPEAFQIVAGGRSAAQTTGSSFKGFRTLKAYKNSRTPPGCEDYRLMIRWSSLRSRPPATFPQTLRVAIVYGIPNLDKRGFKVAINAHGPRFDLDIGDRIVSPASLTAVRRHLAKRVERRRLPGPSLHVSDNRREVGHRKAVIKFDIRNSPSELLRRWVIKHGPAVGEQVAALISGDAKVEPRFALATKEKAHQRKVF